jgi:hypothetical protein
MNETEELKKNLGKSTWTFLHMMAAGNKNKK